MLLNTHLGHPSTPQIVYLETEEESDFEEQVEVLNEQIEERAGSVVGAGAELRNADMCLGKSLTAYLDDFHSPIFPKPDPALSDVLEPGELVITHGDDPSVTKRKHHLLDSLTGVGAMTPQGLVMLYEKPSANKREGRLVYADYPEQMQQTLETAVGPISPDKPVTDKQVVAILGVYTEDFGPMGDDNLGQLLAEEHLENVGPYSITFDAKNEDRGIDGHITRTYLV